MRRLNCLKLAGRFVLEKLAKPHVVGEVLCGGSRNTLSIVGLSLVYRY